MTTLAIGPVKFLLVDDQEQNLVALSALLEREGLELLTAKTGEEALELLLAHEVALAFLDVQMPGMDGFALAELMRGAQRTRHVPIIFVTANPLEQGRVFRGYDAGAVDFLVKPLDPAILRHKAETFFRLARQKQELAETLRLNEMFVAAVGHDLRNPLNSMMMCAQLLSAADTDAQTRRIAERLSSSGRRMARMIEELFDLSRVRLGGGLPIQRTKCDARAIADRVVSEHRTAVPDRAIEIEGDARADGEWDPGRLEQLFSNLVGNAIAHGAPAGPVSVRLALDGGDLVLAVHNQGVIPPETLPHLFQPFVSRRKGKQPTEGLGLGLYIVEQIVLAHGGTVGVRSTVEEGTSFHVRVPARAVEPPAR